ncbi:helix-turn-helix domain-containing protein (plasmid) [Ensifer adhaerens]|uniref:helix-turn-helix domain-containing protein n=1 Tax=Ensifer adhaerens TaxID=106592 RepID=UPI001CBA807F|nr:helix-turn-helix domain-containing protein [Ensifer adhaerens]UAX97870.1 helix-turn-helix domain-containing protein [Ensifer adhaerens]UAY05249.1 helix-turn-helix domain-containing protein [Ensifer adhaerens]UAY12627.1 helix-turn-helix domain-containing protein [Ensifer adhaerens]
MQEAVVAHIGIRIRARRIRSRMSRAELGAIVGLTGGQVGDVERGVSWVSPYQLLSIADALEVDASHFFSDQHLLQHLLRGNRQPRSWALIRPVRSLRSASHSCSNNGRGIDCGFDRAQHRSLSNAEVSAGAVPSG